MFSWLTSVSTTACIIADHQNTTLVTAHVQFHDQTNTPKKTCMHGTPNGSDAHRLRNTVRPTTIAAILKVQNSSSLVNSNAGRGNSQHIGHGNHVPQHQTPQHVRGGTTTLAHAPS
jgi:hypothetical protein